MTSWQPTNSAKYSWAQTFHVTDWHAHKLRQNLEVFLYNAYISIIYLKVARGSILLVPLMYSNQNILGSNSSNKHDKFGVNYSQLKMSHLVWDSRFITDLYTGQWFLFTRVRGQGLIDWRSLDLIGWKHWLPRSHFGYPFWMARAKRQVHTPDTLGTLPDIAANARPLRAWLKCRTITTHARESVADLSRNCKCFCSRESVHARVTESRAQGTGVGRDIRQSP